MREPIATAPATGAATMFGISNAQLVQHSFNGGLPPLKADSPMPSPAGILRPVSRASSVGGAATGGTLDSVKSSSGASSPAASVKRNSSSSSFGSSSDRRSVFYTDPIPDSDQSSRGKEKPQLDRAHRSVEKFRAPRSRSSLGEADTGTSSRNSATVYWQPVGRSSASWNRNRVLMQHRADLDLKIVHCLAA
ncbi:hypothetical protein ZHAS_00008576 [Anopheles sinensis]|uniref:Uncharacterized protein n=1 Tax=Anopheles sinensis TaxID=74873 RepID=A0A084VT23_ANOSI|nr:hypothetical protein ZHAS_00008576 [Anopheles sinensis]